MGMRCAICSENGPHPSHVDKDRRDRMVCLFRKAETTSAYI